MRARPFGVYDRQLLRDFIYSMASKASKLPLLTKPILMHKGGNGTGIATHSQKKGFTYGRSLSLPGSLHIKLEEKNIEKW